MPLIWRRVAWFVSFAIAVLVLIWLRDWAYGWLVAAVVWVVLPAIISQVCAAFVLARAHWRMRRIPDLMDKTREAIKGLPPEEQEAAAKRVIDEAFGRKARRRRG